MRTQNSAADIVSSHEEEFSGAPRLVTAHADERHREFELLCRCCGDEQGVPQALGHRLQWDRVFEQASYHRLLPSLYAALRNLPEVPASIQSALRAR